MDESKLKKALPQGTVLESNVGKYVVKKVLGAGGFGITYLVVGKVQNVDVELAVKEHFISEYCERFGSTVTCSGPISDKVKASLRDFKSEATRLNKVGLKHNSLVSINEVFERNNTAYYVMEFVPGRNIRQFIKESPIGTVSELEALRIIAPILDALALLHSKRITHLDIKPDNIILSVDRITDRTRPVIIDFGLSKSYNEDGSPTSQINVSGCSEGYSPLEQYAGIKEFSPKADVYAVAATLLYLLTGKQPLNASEMSRRVIVDRLNGITGMRTCEAIINAMNPQHHYRTSSIQQFAADLGIVLPLIPDMKVKDPIVLPGDYPTVRVAPPKNQDIQPSIKEVEDKPIWIDNGPNPQKQQDGAVNTPEESKNRNGGNYIKPEAQAVDIKIVNPPVSPIAAEKPEQSKQPPGVKPKPPVWNPPKPPAAEVKGKVTTPQNDGEQRSKAGTPKSTLAGGQPRVTVCPPPTEPKVAPGPSHSNSGSKPWHGNPNSGSANSAHPKPHTGFNSGNGNNGGKQSRGTYNSGSKIHSNTTPQHNPTQYYPGETQIIGGGNNGGHNYSGNNSYAGNNGYPGSQPPPRGNNRGMMYGIIIGTAIILAILIVILFKAVFNNDPEESRIISDSAFVIEQTDTTAVRDSLTVSSTDSLNVKSMARQANGTATSASLKESSNLATPHRMSGRKVQSRVRQQGGYEAMADSTY